MSRASPFFRSPLYGNPARYGDYHFEAPPPPPETAKPKVVSIPVHFVGSDNDNKKRTDRAAAAINVQKAFRGFLVRKNVRIAREIEAEVDEIEMKFRREQELDLIVRDEKERLRINEMLMRLLLRLDSVRGVRDYRKRVIRRVIALQEMVDSISAGRSAEQALETAAEESLETKPDVVVEEVKTLGDGGQVPEMAEPEEELGELEPIEESETLETSNQVDPMEMHQEVESKTLESGHQISAGWELLETTKEVDDAEALMEEESIPESTVDSSAQEVKKESSIDNETPESESEKNQERGMKDVMERMVAENEKLKGLVALLCERSAQQCRLMGGLAQRVEHLEKIVEKMERKRRRKDSSSSPATGANNNKQLQ